MSSVPATDPAPCDTRGEGPWLVAVPGLGLSAAVPRHTLDRLSRPSRVVELPAFGEPAPRGTTLAPEELARQLLTRIEAFTAGPAVLVGHSASCQIVAAAAAHAPGRVAGLVLVGPTTDPRSRGWPVLVARWLRTASHERPGQVPRLVHDYARTGLGAMRRGMDAARHHRIDRALGDVHCPVLVVRGRHDRIASADWTTALAATAPRGRAHTLSGGGHMLPITHAAALAALIEEFLDTRVGRPAPPVPDTSRSGRKPGNGRTADRQDAPVEYVIRPVDGDPLDLLFHFDRMPEVLTPRGFDVRRLPGQGLLLALDGAEIAFDHDLPGWLVLIEGELPEERADQLVATVARQVQEATGVPTEWFRND